MGSEHHNVQRLIRAAKRAGLTVVPGEHHKVYLGPQFVCAIPCSPSDHRWMENKIKECRRRSGIDLRNYL